MIDFKKIVLTTDFSKSAEAATPSAIQLARKFGGCIHLLHVFDFDQYIPDAFMAGIVMGVSSWIESQREQPQRLLNAIAKSLAESHSIEVLPILLNGHPAREIANYAQKNGMDCIVIATHGAGPLSHAVFGSVAERVVRLSPCSVLTVRSFGRPEQSSLVK